MNTKKFEIFRNKNILLLQGPVGPFFKKFADKLKTELNANVYKINFNGGDYFFFPDGINFTLKSTEYDIFLENIIVENKIDSIVVFGDCREYHIKAKKISEKLKIDFYVFEEGYLRPGYITFEKYGVNAFSVLTSIFDPKNKYTQKENSCYEEIKQSNLKIALFINIYWFFTILLKYKFKHYIHHRSFGIFTSFKFIKAWVRRRIDEKQDKKTLLEYTKKTKNNFFVPLQVSTDSQVIVHSEFKKMEDFIENIFIEFKKSKLKNYKIIFKDHPLEIEKNYKKIVFCLAKKHSLEDNVLFVRMVDLKMILDFTSAVITINSTVGLTSLIHNKPVFTYGKSIYSAFSDSTDLNLFILNYNKIKPNKKIIKNFVDFLKLNNQIKASFYS